jgi:hypothetical protein
VDEERHTMSSEDGRDVRRVRGGPVLLVAVVLLAVIGAVGTSGADSGRLEPTSWWLSSQPYGRTVDVAVLVGSDGCEQLEDVLVNESSSRVRLQARVRATDHGSECREDLRYVPQTVTLDQPLGSRTLTGCAVRDDRLYPAPSSCSDVEAPGPVPRVGEARPSA